MLLEGYKPLPNKAAFIENSNKSAACTKYFNFIELSFFEIFQITKL